LNQLEASSPGTKAQFFLGYLDRAAGLFSEEDRAELRPCGSCGQPTTGRFCAFCRARAQILGLPLAERRSGGNDDRPAPAAERQIAEEISEEVLPGEIYRRAGV
jgi:tRNA(Ile)-lysidine synthase TilS/MesJ